MKFLRILFSAIPSPIYAIFGRLSGVRATTEIDVGIWFGIAFVLTIASSVTDLIGWNRFVIERLTWMAWVCFLICRLALAEEDIKKLRAQATGSNQQ